MSWDPGQYLKYADERARPAQDLIARVPLKAPRAIVDLGCGAGNVTRLLARRWPGATITGVDSSKQMLESARASIDAGMRIEWHEGDLAQWKPDTAAPPDLLYSNAALHWLDDHAAFFPRLFANLAPGGVLAVQMPDNFGAPSHRLLAETVAFPQWRERLQSRQRPAPVAAAARYFDWLAPRASTIDIWTTDYLHVLPANPGGDHPVVAWTRGTALTPYLSALDDAGARAFVDDYSERVRGAYPLRSDGRALYPFRRLFIVATRSPDQNR